MPMPMMNMPTDWKATGALGGLYGGMQAQYQSDAMKDATRQAELDYALKQHDYQQRLLDDPVREAQRTSEITKANEFNTLSPTRIDSAQTDLEDKKYSLAEKKRIAQTAAQAEFFSGLPQALEESKQGGPAAQKAVWDDYNAKGKALGINIGDEWNLDNEARLKSNAQKALQTLPHLREMAKVAAQGDIQKTIHREEAGSREYIERMKDIAHANEGEANRANALEIAKLRGNTTVEAAQARTAYKPKNYVEVLQMKANSGEPLNPGEQKIVDNAEFISIYKAINPGTNPDVQLASLAKAAAEPGPGQAVAQQKFDEAMTSVVKTAKDAVAQVQNRNTSRTSATSTAPVIKEGKGGIKYRQIPGTDGTKKEDWEEIK